MSLPPINPEKTASGIVVDPRTLERVIPATRRKDGSVRKEQKVRAGFVPQEDRSAFRGRRQLEAEARRGMVPGSARPAAASSAMTIPLERRVSPKRPEPKRVERAEKRTEHHNWDSESDSEDEEEATRRAFAQLKVDTKDEKAFPPLGGSKNPTKASSPTKGSPQKSAWKTLPPAPARESASSPTPPPTASSSSSSVPSAPLTGADAPSWRSARGRGMPRGRGGPPPRGGASSYTSKPHPIQGGRKGPIGLAHPPPISPPKARRNGGNKSEPARKAEKQEKPERIRQPVRVREGGPLADRVRNLVLQNQADDRPKRTASSTSTANGGTSSASASGGGTTSA